MRNVLFNVWQDVENLEISFEDFVLIKDAEFMQLSEVSNVKIQFAFIFIKEFVDLKKDEVVSLSLCLELSQSL